MARGHGQRHGQRHLEKFSHPHSTLVRKEAERRRRGSVANGTHTVARSGEECPEAPGAHVTRTRSQSPPAPLPPWMREMLLAVVAPPAAHDPWARAKPLAVRSHAVAWRAALGAEAVGLLEPAVYGLRAVGHPARAVALAAGTIAL